MAVEVPPALQQFGATPIAAVQGLVRGQVSKFRQGIKRAANRLGMKTISRKVDGKTYVVDFTDDAGDGVNETAAKLILLLQTNVVAVGDEFLRVWLGQSQGEWTADAQSAWSDYVVDHPSLVKATYSNDGRNAFEPISMTVIIGGLIALAPVVLPILLSMVQDFFKSAAEKDKAAAEQQAKKDQAANDLKKAEDQQKTIIIAGVAGLLLVFGIGAVVYMKKKGGA